MNLWIDWLNSWSGALFSLALPMLLQSTVVTAGLLLFDALIRKRVSATARHALLLLVLVKLLLPPSLALPTSPLYWLRASKQSTLKITTPPAQIFVTVPTETVPSSSIPPVPVPLQKQSTFSQASVLAMVWAAGALALCAALVLHTRRVAKLIRNATEADPCVDEIARRCREELGCRRHIPVKLSSEIKCPALCGLWRPVILIPTRLTATLSESQFRAVLLHELTHYKRGDVWINGAQTLLQIVYWFHPMLWLANAAIRRTREQAVDETVMLVLAQEADTYSETLLKVAKGALAAPRLSLGLVGILETPSALRQRLIRLTNRLPKGAGRVGILWRLATVALAVALLPMAQGARTATDLPPDQTPDAANKSNDVELTAQLMVASEEAYAGLNLGESTIRSTEEPGAIGPIWLLNEKDLAALRQRTQSLPGMLIGHAQKVVTPNNFTRTILVDGSSVEKNQLPQFSFTTELTPLKLNGRIDLNVTGVATVVGSVVGNSPTVKIGAAANQNDSTPPSSKNTNEAPSQNGGAVFAANAVGYVNINLKPARISLKQGQSALIYYPQLAALAPRLNPFLILSAKSPDLKAAQTSLPDNKPASTSNLKVTRVYLLGPRDGEPLQKRLQNARPGGEKLGMVAYDGRTKSLVVVGTPAQQDWVEHELSPGVSTAEPVEKEGQTTGPRSLPTQMTRTFDVTQEELLNILTEQLRRSGTIPNPNLLSSLPFGAGKAELIGATNSSKSQTQLLIRGTGEQLDAIEKVLSQIRIHKTQIVLEARLAEFPTEGAFPPTKSTATRSSQAKPFGVMVTPQARDFIRAIEQSGATNLFAPAKVVTLNQRKVQFEFPFSSGAKTNLILNVMPVVSKNGLSMQLDLDSSLQQVAGETQKDVGITTSPGQDILNTKAVIWDGQTVVIEVPKSLQQTGGKQTLIFLTARMIDPTGNVLHDDSQLSSIKDSVPSE